MMVLMETVLCFLDCCYGGGAGAGAINHIDSYGEGAELTNCIRINHPSHQLKQNQTIKKSSMIFPGDASPHLPGFHNSQRAGGNILSVIFQQPVLDVSCFDRIPLNKEI